MVPADKLAQITERFEFLEAQLNAGTASPGEVARISKEYTDLKPVVDEIRAYRQSLDDLAGINLVGGDVVEVSPPYDTTGATAIAGAHVAYDLICLYHWARTQR